MTRRNRDVISETSYTTDRPMASAALAQAITLARKGKSAPLRDQRVGRIDSRRLSRVALADPRIRVKRGAPAPDKVRVSILIDASGSMDSAITDAKGYPMMDEHHNYIYVSHACAQIARDLAGAMEMLPWVKGDITGFTTGGGEVRVYPVWKSGQPTSNVEAYNSIPKSGTEEGYALAFARDEMLERLVGREQGLIIIISDGAPSEPGHVKAVVEQCRKDRIPVVSVSLVASAHQPLMYGKENVVDFDGNVRRLARDMAKVMGRVI